MPRCAPSVRAILLVPLLLLLLNACNASSLPATQPAALEGPTPLPSRTSSASAATVAVDATPIIPSVTASTTVSSTSGTNFKVAVIVDTRSASVTRAQAQAVLDEGSRFLRPFTPFGLEMVAFVEDSSGGSMNDMANRFFAPHGTELPNGIVIFSLGDEGRAKLSGRYSYALAAPTGYKNTFVPLVGGAGKIVIAVVDFKLKYMPCGYGTSDTVHSATSVGAECRNQPGTACIQHNGYSMCANGVGNLYASTPTHYISSTVVHELLQPFAPGGEQDNYATAECSSHMGYPTGFFDLQESQYYNDLCPFVYDNLVKSYRP